MDDFVFPANLVTYAVIIKTILSIAKQYMNLTEPVIKGVALAMGILLSFTMPVEVLIIPVVAGAAPWLFWVARIVTGVMTGAGAIGIHELSRNKTQKTT